MEEKRDDDPASGGPTFWELEHGAVGSMWPIRPMPSRIVSVTADGWSVQLVPGIDAAMIMCREPSEGLGPDGHRRKAERCLDALSWEGGGHYELAPLQGSAEHLLWDWTKKAPRAQITLSWEHMIPGSIRSQPADQPVNQEYSTRYTPAMRYYRCAQVAANPVAAFQNLYLAFEFLAAERVPLNEDERGKESVWLKRAIVELVEQYPAAVREALDSKAKGDRFYKRIYKAARCATFHAKPHEGPVAPFDEKEREVREAHRLLMPHVQELLRSASGWPEGHHIVSEEELKLTGSIPLTLQGAAFTLNSPKNATWRRYNAHTWEEGNVPRTFCLSTRLDPEMTGAVKGIRWNLGPMPVNHAFKVFPRTPTAIDVDVRLVVGARFDGWVQSPRSPLDHIAPLRSSTKMSHRAIGKTKSLS